MYYTLKIKLSIKHSSFFVLTSFRIDEIALPLLVGDEGVSAVGTGLCNHVAFLDELLLDHLLARWASSSGHEVGLG
ncbi:hypothetical protein MsedE_0847 [Metallosphaera sedula]|uniref:Uncharacterized protein n=1 Tax=Metallosphaera sedula TaxID=43687 RepID=A0A0K1T7M1_9CREN|nr:hypothetical protein MsedE_0847 [Metallosphaera sedula]